MSTLPPGSTVGTGHIRFTPLAGTAGAIRVGVLQVKPSSSEKLTNASSDSGSCPTQIAPAGSPVGQANYSGDRGRTSFACEGHINSPCVTAAGSDGNTRRIHSGGEIVTSWRGVRETHVSAGYAYWSAEAHTAIQRCSDLDIRVSGFNAATGSGEGWPLQPCNVDYAFRSNRWHRALLNGSGLTAIRICRIRNKRHVGTDNLGALPGITAIVCPPQLDLSASEMRNTAHFDEVGHGYVRGAAPIFGRGNSLLVITIRIVWIGGSKCSHVAESETAADKVAAVYAHT